MIPRRWLLAPVLAVAAALGAHAARADTSLTHPEGYVEVRALRLSDAAESQGSFLRFRPTWHGKSDGGDLRWRLTAEVRGYGGAAEAPDGDRGEGRIERAYVESVIGRDTLRLGRQAVNWGHGLLFNPTDPFRELFLTNFWYERAGVDGLRYLHPIGASGGVVATVGTVGDWDERTTALRWFQAREGLDYALVFLRDERTERDRVGVDLKGDLTVGWWFEGVRAEGPGDTSFHEWVAGLDYTFSVRQNLYVALQTYYDGSGARAPLFYDWAGVATGARRTLGRRYLLARSQLKWTRDLHYNLDVVRNDEDGSRVVTPYVSLRIDDATQLHVGVNLYRGPPGSEFQPTPLQDPFDRVPRSIAYVWVRTHF